MMSDMHEPTAWEEINPQTALARQPEQRLVCSALQPATSDQFRNELTACLALVAPVGMTEEARREWLMVAWETLKHLPPDMLASGCKAARASSDHHSKIVPAIIAATDEWMETRRNNSRAMAPLAIPGPPPKRHIADRDRRTFVAEDWAELNEWLESQGAGARYHPDGTRYLIDGRA